MILGRVLPRPDRGPNRYTCRFFDGRNCGAYENRPSMCRDYPYGNKREHGEKCAWDAAREGRHHLPVIQDRKAA